MKIGVFLGSLGTHEGGGFTFQETVLFELAKEKRAHEFIFFYYAKHDLDAREGMGDFQQIKLGSPGFITRLKRKLGRIIGLEDDPGGSLYHAAQQADVDLMWFPTYAFEYTDLPYIYTIWDLQHRLQPFFPEVSRDGEWSKRETGYAQIISRATYVLTGTERGKEEIKMFYNVPDERFKLLPHPTPEFALEPVTKSEAILSKFGLEPGFLLYPAQFWSHKNHIRILQALHILKAEHDLGYKVVFVGSNKGNFSYIKREVTSLGLEDEVFILDFVDREDLVQLYLHAHALVYATLFGPENLPPLEAMALGCPVIASDVPGSQEQYGDNVLTFKRMDAQDLAMKIKLLYEDEEVREQLISKGRKRANEYTSKDYIQDIAQILDEFEQYRICWG